MSLRELILANTSYRRTLVTEDAMQLVAMHLKPREEIGLESHPEEQFIYVESGDEGILLLEKEAINLGPGSGYVIPSQALHNIINLSLTEPLKLFIIYSPPKHPLRENSRNREQALN
jgi:mannose-6-phosphate isomerase-like protein (cupin superfamily)